MYRQAIIDLVNSIDSDQALKTIYNFVFHIWKRC